MTTVPNSGTITIFNSTISNNYRDGIWLYEATNVDILNNSIYDCGFGLGGGQGIYVQGSKSSNCTIYGNKLTNNYGGGIYIDSGSGNLIYANTFIDNGFFSQASDYGSNNNWYHPVLLIGNYWSDHSGSGEYPIFGSAGSVDLYPTGPIIVAEYPDISLIIGIICIIALFSILYFKRK